MSIMSSWNPYQEQNCICSLVRMLIRCCRKRQSEMSIIWFKLKKKKGTEINSTVYFFTKMVFSSLKHWYMSPKSKVFPSLKWFNSVGFDWRKHLYFNSVQFWRHQISNICYWCCLGWTMMIELVFGKFNT